MRRKHQKGRKTGLFIFLCIAVFIVSFAGSAIFKMAYTSHKMRKYSVDWSDEIGTVYKDFAYGEKTAQKFPFVVKEAKKLGYPVDRMAISGGSAGGCLALLYAYRDADTSPVPVKMVFEAVGPASFYAEDWAVYGLDQDPEAAAGLFGTMAGKKITPAMLQTAEYEKIIKDISAYMWEYIVFPHSGHALQNDDKCYIQYMDKVVEYLDTYMAN